MIRLRGEGERALTERVYAQCWMPFGQRRQICCEQVEITAADAALADLPSVRAAAGRGRSAGDPVVPQRRACSACRSSARSRRMARKVVLDSAAMPDAKDALRRLVGELASAACMLGDLAWTRLTRWREMLSQVFENRERARADCGDSPRARELRRRLRDGGAGIMAAWIGDALAEAGAHPTLAVEPRERRPRCASN